MAESKSNKILTFNYASPFSDLSMKDLESILGEEVVDTSDINSYKDFYRGDHWQNGNGWVGPKPAENSVNFDIIIESIRNTFVSKNAVAEVVNRHSDGVLSKLNSSWYLVRDKGSNKISSDGKIVDDNEVTDDNKAVDEELSQITSVIKNWWTNRKVNYHITEALSQLLLHGRGGLKLFVPSGKLENNTVPAVDFNNAFEYIYVESPSVSDICVKKDSMTMDEAYVHIYTQKINGKDVKFAEIGYVDPQTGLTVLKQFSDGDTDDSQMIPIDLKHGNMYMEVDRRRFITKSVIDNQKLLNKSLTMMSRNVDLAGFLERTILNADLPGTWVEDSTAPGGRRYKPQPLSIGAGMTTTLHSTVVEDDEGKKTVLPVDIRYRDPVPVQSFSDTKKEAYTCILEDCEQTHMIIAGDAFASGESRIQARANFATSLLVTKYEVDKLITWLVDTVIQLAAVFSSSPDQYTDIKSVSNLKPDIGPLTPQEREQIMLQYGKGLISRETTMVILGIDNPEEEMIKMIKERRVTSFAEWAALITALSKTGWQLSIEQMPEVDMNILGLTARNVETYKKELDEDAKRQSLSGANFGAKGGSPKGSTNEDGSQSPGMDQNIE